MLGILRGLTKGQARGGKQNNFVLPVAGVVVLFLFGQAYWLSSHTHLFAPFTIKRIDCDHCSKVGVVRDVKDNSIMQMCQACFGVGYHSLRRFDDQDAVCLACGGLGRLEENGIWRTCDRCEGRGVFRLDDWKVVVAMETVDIDTQPSSAKDAADRQSEEEQETTDALDAETQNPKPLNP